MKRLFIIAGVALTLLLGSCATHKDATGTYGVSATGAQTFKPDTLDNQKVDSLLRVDNLPAVKKWATSTFVDEETRTAIVYKTLYDRTSKTIYTLKTLPDGRFVLIKRAIATR